MGKFDRLSEAIFSEAFPANPLPFAFGLAEFIKEGKHSDLIKSDKAKRILFVLMAQAYGQLTRIDLCDEWQRLANTDGFKHGAKEEACV